MRQSLQILTSRLRFKVLCAALGVVLIACISGWIGLRYTHTVTASVTAATEFNLPLLTNAINASNAMHSLTNMAQNLLVACDVADGSHRLLFNGSMKESFVAIEALAGFLSKAGIREYEVKVTSAKDELFHAINNLSTICDTRTTLQQQFEEQVRHATASITGLNQVLNELNADFEQQSSRVPGNSGNPGDEDYAIGPALQGLYQMKARLVEIGSGLAYAHSNSSVNSGNQQIQRNEAAMNELADDYQGIISILRNNGYASEIDRMSPLMEQLSGAVLGPGGVHDIWRRASLFHSGTVIPRMALTRAEIALTSALQGMEAEARRRYQQATDNIRDITTEARWVVASVTGIGAIVLLLGGLLLSARLTRPIEKLKEFVLQLRGSDELSQEMPPGLVERQDEVGALAQSFNDLITDLSEARQRLLDESKANIRVQYERLSTAIESIPQGLCLFDAKDRLLMRNSRFLTLYDLTPEQAREGVPLRQVAAACVANGTRLIDREDAEDNIQKRSGFLREQQILNFRGERTIVVGTARTPEGGLVSVHEDITERRRQEEKIAHLAHHDTLTGLANRRLFRNRFGRVLANLEKKQSVALLYLDLDRFKTVNDTLGHPVGDQLLVAVAERLRSCLREIDKVARLGGDEFAILLTENPDAEEAARVSRRIIHKIGLPFDIDGQNIVVGVSVGIAMAPFDGKDPDKLMKCADMALYRAKREGRNTFWFFESEMDAKVQARRTLELDLREAMEANAFELYYQPQLGTEHHTIEGFEALIRWHHDSRGFVSPADFIPIAEETGLITTIGRWVLMQACQDAMAWPDSILVAVNISPIQFRADTLLADVGDALSASGLPPYRLELEITEGTLMQDTDTAIDTLEALRQMGIHISMDDFGTGYSSLSYIRKFNFDRIKIDQSFVHDVVTSSDSQAVVHAVCSLCSGLGIESIAEGVETDQQLMFLEKEGCSQVQGFYFGKPMPASEVLVLIGSEFSELGDFS